MPEQPARTASMRCLLDDDPRRARPVDGPASRVCKAHRERLVELLDPTQRGQMFTRPDERRIPPSIPVLWRLLDAQPGSGTEHVTGGGGVFGSRPPGRLDVMALRDLRTQPAEHDALWSVLRTMLAIAVQLDVRDIDNRPVPIPRSVEGCSAWLHLRLDRLCAVAWVDDAFHDLRTLHSQLRGSAGDPAPRPLGPCRKRVDDDGRLDPAGKWECGVPLHLPHQGLKGMDEPVHLPTTLTCTACHGTYTRVEYERLRLERGIKEELPA